MYCKNCDNHHVGLTVTSFSQHRTNHRELWNKFCYTKKDNNLVLLRHYNEHHKPISIGKLEIAQCFCFLYLKLKRYVTKYLLLCNAKININTVVYFEHNLYPLLTAFQCALLLCLLNLQTFLS